MRFTDTLTRVRPARKPDPRNPERTIPDESNLDRLPVSGFLDVEESQDIPDASRSETTATTTFYTEPSVDVRRGDRLEADDDRVWRVKGFTTAPKNPFTGWQPYRICRLSEVKG
jgi:hypothetical protein